MKRYLGLYTGIEGQWKRKSKLVYLSQGPGKIDVSAARSHSALRNPYMQGRQGFPTEL